MTLMRALQIIADVHTEGLGVPAHPFAVRAGAIPDRYHGSYPVHEYIEAWRVVRIEAGLMPEQSK